MADYARCPGTSGSTIRISRRKFSFDLSYAILKSGATRRGRIRRGINTGRIYTYRSLHSFVTLLPLTSIYLTLAPWMTLDSVRDRHRHLVEHDWKSAAAEYFATNWKDGEVSLIEPPWKPLTHCTVPVPAIDQ
jgi:hypothetical protein